MRIALIHESPEYRRQFAQRYLGKAHIMLFDSRLDSDELVQGARNSGGIDLAVVSVSDENPSAADYISALRKSFKKARIIATLPESDTSTNTFHASFLGARYLESEEYVLDHLEEIAVKSK